MQAFQFIKFLSRTSSLINSLVTTKSSSNINNSLFKTFRTMSSVSYLNQKDAINLDKELFNDCQFSVDQLMELAGLSVALMIKNCYPIEKLKNNKVLICCGPGNNGGDGLVAARHLKLFHYDPEVYYSKKGSSKLFTRLEKQLESFEIKITNDLSNIDHALIVDSLFGFSFKPPVRPQFVEVLNKIANAKQSKLISVDIPSGWNVESGPSSSDEIVLKPDCLVSLTAPKLCAKHFKGEHHYLGGRFIPDKIARKYNLTLPPYSNVDQFVKI